MRGYVAQRRDRFYAVIYEGIDPITGRERRRWHPAGTDRAEAEQLAARLAAESPRRRCGRRVRDRRSACISPATWLPTKQLTLRPSTWDSYRRNVELHVLPELGRVPIRHLRAEHLERLYAKLLDHGRANGRGGLDAKTVLEIHMVLRRRARRRPPTRDHHPQPRRDRARTETSAARQCRTTRLERPTTQGLSRLSPPTIASSQRSGSPRTPACDAANSSACVGATSTSTTQRLSVNRALISVGYELHESRGKTRTARRAIDLDERTIAILTAISTAARHDGYVFCHIDGTPIHPHVVSDAFKKLVARSGLPRIRLPRPPPHPRHAAAQSRRPHQGRQRTTRARDARLHDGDLPTRPARHATRSRPHLRRDPRPVYRFHPVEHPVERRATRRSPGQRQAADLGFSVAGQGFEPSTFGL